MATRPISSVLTDQQRERFDRDGFLTFDPEIPDEVLDRVLSDVGEKYSFEGTGKTIDEYGVKYSSGPNPRITYAWKVSEAVKQVALAPKVLAVLEELYGHRPIPFQTLNFMNGTEQHVHVDGMYFNSEPAGWMCGVWVALEDIDMDNGPPVYTREATSCPSRHGKRWVTWTGRSSRATTSSSSSGRGATTATSRSRSSATTESRSTARSEEARR